MRYRDTVARYTRTVPHGITSGERGGVEEGRKARNDEKAAARRRK